MSGGGGKVRASSSSTTTRVSMPKKIQDMIRTIKEIAGAHTDEDIHAMLKECSMDPNEAAQKLLAQDPFHEVRRKRDKKKENLNNKELSDSRWRTGTQGRGGRGGRGIIPPRYSTDAGEAKHAGKENGVKHGPDRGAVSSSLPVPQEAERKVSRPVPSSLSGVDDPTNIANGRARQVPARSGVHHPKRTAAIASVEASLHLPSSVVAKTSPSEVNVIHEQPASNSDNLASPVSVLGVYSSATDPVLVPSLESRLPGIVGTIKREVGSQRTGTESIPATFGETTSSASQDTTSHLQINKVVPHEVTKPELSLSMNENKPLDAGNSTMHGKTACKSQTFERNQSSETPHYSSSSLHGGTSGSRPSSNYGSRSQQPIGSQKAVGPSKEWKPKPTNPVSAPASSVIVRMGDVGHVTVEAGAPCSVSTPSTISEESTSKLQQKLDELHFSQNQHVIIPDHLQVPEAERTGLSFGSFDANFGLTRCYNNDPDTDKMSTPLSESSQEAECLANEPCISNQVESLTTPEGDYSGHPQSPKTVPDTLSLAEADVSSSVGHEYEQAKQEISGPLGGPQYSVVHTAPNYNFGFMPPILGTQFAPFDTSEPQARDASRLPSFVVQQAFDPSASYYTQFYRATGEGDGRFPAPGAANKYNGGASLESGNSVVLSSATSSTTPPAGGVMQQSQQLAVFRQPHLGPPHYPPNYIPYSSQYFTPQFYMPPPQIIHHYLTTNPAAAFPHTSVYPPPPAAAAAAAGVKFSLSPQFKPVTTSNSGYAPFTSPSATTSTTTPASGNEELSTASSHYNKEYVTGGQQQQASEGSGVWIPGRDIYPSSFYSLSPHQGQHVTFAAAPTTMPAAAFYHQHPTPTAQSQSMQSGVEMISVYQQQPQPPQRAQMNWTANY